MFFCHAPNYKQENRKLGSAGVVWLLSTLSHSLYIDISLAKKHMNHCQVSANGVGKRASGCYAQRTFKFNLYYIISFFLYFLFFDFIN